MQKVAQLTAVHINARLSMHGDPQRNPELPGGGRYFANPQEQKILIQGLQSYFAFPERSQNRNKIAKEVSQFLHLFSPHWTHRAVRLWFNNNRHTYLGDADAPRPDAPPMPAPTSPKSSKRERPAEPPRAPAFADSAPGFPTTQAPTASGIAIPPQQFHALHPLSFSHPSQTTQPPVEQLYQSASALINEIRRMTDSDPRRHTQIMEFDDNCLKIISNLRTIKPERIEPALKFVPFPFPRDESREFRFLESPSSEFSEFTMGGSFFNHPVYGSDIPRDFLGDHSGTHTIWQRRDFDDIKLGYFEAAALTTQCAAFVLPIGAHQKAVQFMRYRETAQQWQGISLDVQKPVEAMCLNEDTAWILTDSVAHGISLIGDPPIIVRLTATGSGTIAPMGEGIVAGFPNSPRLFLINRRAQVFEVPVRYGGVTSVAAIGDHALCAIPESGTIRMIAADGRDDRSFVGHCGPVVGIARMSQNLFASHGRDETVRVWDTRQPGPLSSVVHPHVSVTCLAGSPLHLVCGFASHRLGVVELRKDHCKPVLGVDTPGLTALSLSYDDSADHLSLFGASDQTSIFRRYPTLLSS
jgi:hypothetical protein